MKTFVNPIKTANIELGFNGDKSLSHRLVLAALLGPKIIHLHNLSPCQDVKTTLNIVAKLGAEVTYNGLSNVTINSLNIFGIRDSKPYFKPSLGSPSEPHVLYCGNSGTSARLLCGILSNFPGYFLITGDESLSNRPMSRVTEPLKKMGFNISCENGKTLPIIIKPKGKIKGIRFFNKTGSAQVKSAIELASFIAEVKSEIKETYESRDHTKRLLNFFKENPKKELSFDIPGDISSGAYFAAIGAMYKDGSAHLRNVLLNKTRMGFFQILKKMGAGIKVEIKEDKWEPWGDVLIEGKELKSINVGQNEVPATIDELPLLGVLMGLSGKKSSIRGAKELRYKECDRIGALVEGLKTFGVECLEHEDGFETLGYEPWAGVVEVDSFKDHRIAMSFGVLGLKSRLGAWIKGAESVEISFPSFWELLKTVK